MERYRPHNRPSDQRARQRTDSTDSEAARQTWSRDESTDNQLAERTDHLGRSTSFGATSWLHPRPCHPSTCARRVGTTAAGAVPFLSHASLPLRSTRLLARTSASRRNASLLLRVLLIGALSVDIFADTSRASG
jgi:hypothetical protein